MSVQPDAVQGHDARIEVEAGHYGIAAQSTSLQ